MSYPNTKHSNKYNRRLFKFTICAISIFVIVLIISFFIIMSFLLHAHDTSFYVLCISIQFYLLFFVHTSSLSLSSSQSTTSYVYIHSLLHWKTRRIVHTTKQCESECQPASHQTWTLCVYLTINFDIHLSLLMVRTMKNALRASFTYFSLAKHLSNRR